MRTWHLRGMALLCAMLITLTAFMPGTFAWYSDQKATNSVYGSGTVKIPVELIKLEKQEDGTVTDISVPKSVSGYDITNTHIGMPDDPDRPTDPTEPSKPTDPSRPTAPADPGKPEDPPQPEIIPTCSCGS